MKPSFTAWITVIFCGTDIILSEKIDSGTEALILSTIGVLL